MAQPHDEKGTRSYIPSLILQFMEQTGAIMEFLSRFFIKVLYPPFEVKETLQQCVRAGLGTLPLVGTAGFIIGLVLTMQLHPIMLMFGAESFLPSTVAISVIREVGPVLTGLICAGKIGSGIGAELGSMKVTEQIDAMEVSGTDPYNFNVVTRIMSTTIMVPILVVYTNAIALFGSFIGLTFLSEITFQLFVFKAFEFIYFVDVIPAFVKTIFFGFAIGGVSSYAGYTAEKGTTGVGKAANKAVVISSLFIFIIDLLAVQLTTFFW